MPLIASHSMTNFNVEVSVNLAVTNSFLFLSPLLSVRLWFIYSALTPVLVLLLLLHYLAVIKLSQGLALLIL